MANLWMENVDADTSEDEIKEFLIRYGFPPFDAIQYVPGTGQSPAVVLSFNNVEEEALRLLQPRIHNIFWRDRTIIVQVIPPEREG
ncbi:RNA-binding protein [Trinickia violacea]|uniref:RNA-binding protein n=1 Tax=Trinickia violacea TaxID=2571746 RepID=A0A4P8IX30_9BURK|nr:RNA-binding protein [Trinickia violacea]QCP52897.1 RNA-binding protein [Trinickia violacea]